MPTPRLDARLKKQFPGLTKRFLEEALEHSLITVDGKRAKKGQSITEKSVVSCKGLQAHLSQLRKGQPMELRIVHQGDDFVIIDKPPGIHGHPLSLFDAETITAWALSKFSQVAEEFPEIQPTVTPHRLDKGTRGLLIVSKTRAAFEDWRERFSQHQVTKTYEAWCWGATSEESFTVESSISHDPKDGRKMLIVDSGEEGARNATTHFEVIRQNRSACLIRGVTRFGVTHQIRVQLASVGLPLVGDKLYDAEFDERKLKPKHHLLIAKRLSYGDLTVTSHFASEALTLA